MRYDLKVNSEDLLLFKQAKDLLTQKYVHVNRKVHQPVYYIQSSSVREVVPGVALRALEDLGNILKEKQNIIFFRVSVNDHSDKAKLILIAYGAQKVHDAVNAKMGWFYRLCDWVISLFKETAKSKIDKVYNEVIANCQKLYKDPSSYEFLSKQA